MKYARFAVLPLSLFLLGAGSSLAKVLFKVQLPTPREHYKRYDPDKAALELMGKILQKLDPKQREAAMKLLASGKPKSLPPITPEEAVRRFREFGFDEYKPELLEVFLHRSGVLDVIPPDYRETLTPIIHDALLGFLDGLSDERLAERFIALARASKTTPRGEKILLLISRLPALQKVGQIVARVKGIPPDISQALQTLESGISTMSRDELVRYIEQEAGRKTLEKYQIRFDDEILAEASVGAVIKGSFVPPGSDRRQEMVCKLIKPYVVTGLPQEMEIIDALIDLVDEHADFYRLGNVPLKELFQDIKAKLADELRVTQEQANFKRAYEYYRGDRRVKVPEIYSFSTPHVTFMEFLHGEKITDAFPGDRKQRARLARRLADVMSVDSLFSRQPTAIFHGDPHAGNVLHLTDDPKNPYRIGLLDWGLLGEFARERRLHMVQLNLALRDKNRKKLRRHVGALLDGGLPEDDARRQRVFRLAEGVLGAPGSTYEVYSNLVAELARNGFVLDPEFTLYIKAQVTLNGIYRELDPSLRLDRYLESRVSRRVLREFPKRLLLLPAWNYRGYRSLLSNGDVFAYIF